jgi:hypothetical protein
MVLELLALSLAFADSAPVNELVTDCPVVAGSPFCEVRSGWIIKPGIGLSDPAMLYGPDGRFRYPLMVRLPGTATFRVEDFAPDSDGSIVAAAIGYEDGGRQVVKSGLARSTATEFRPASLIREIFLPRTLSSRATNPSGCSAATSGSAANHPCGTSIS